MPSGLPESGFMIVSTLMTRPAVHFLDEGRDVLVRRLQHDVLAGSLLDDLAVAQDGDLVAEPQRLVEIVGDEDNGLLQFLLQVEQAPSAYRRG